MSHWTIFDGANFSGRSAALGDALLHTTTALQKPFFIGPYGETGLSGFTTSVLDEHFFYGLPAIPQSPWHDILSSRTTQHISTLSGGEQVMLALSCLSALPDNLSVAIDGALEQLDGPNRMHALEMLDQHPSQPAIFMADNRLSRSDIQHAEYSRCTAPQQEFPLTLSETTARLLHAGPAPVIDARGLTFSYVKQSCIFEDCSLTLEPYEIYHLAGANGSGKSTFLKLLSGVLRPQKGSLFLNGMPYCPWRIGNQILAYALQNPDEQWTSPRPLNDLYRRLASADGDSPARTAGCTNVPDNFVLFLGSLGISPLDNKHILDYPRALRKRISWIWPLSGFRPWLAMDEPTLGQDKDAVHVIAQALQTAKKEGKGIIIISHDERLLDELPHRQLTITNKQVTLL